MEQSNESEIVVDYLDQPMIVTFLESALRDPLIRFYAADDAVVLV